MVRLERVQRRVAGHDAAGERPIFDARDEFGAQRILKDVSARSLEGVILPLMILEDVIECLMLKFMREHQGLQIRAQKTHAVELIGFRVESHPYEVDMIRHQAIDGAEQRFARGCVQQQFAELLMKTITQPAGRPFFQSEIPVNECMRLIEFPIQAREMALMGAVVSRSRRRKEAGRSKASAEFAGDAVGI